MDLISALRFLKLNEIPQAWVDEVWDLEFTEKRALDDNIEKELSACGDDAFSSLYQCLLAHASDPQQSASRDGAQSIWATLRENGVSVKTLVAVLSFFVLAGKANRANVQQRVNGLHAASVYLLLLGVPGSIVTQVYHEVLMDTCTNMTSYCWPQDTGKKRKKDNPKSSQAGGKRSKPQRIEMDVDEGEEEEEAEEEQQFSGQDLMRIREAVVLLVQSLVTLLQSFSLKDRPQSACNCTQIFSKLLYFEPVVGEINFADIQDVTKMKSIPEMALCGLQLLCSPKHGDQKESLRRVFHQLLYVILMMNKGNRTKPTVLVPSQTVLSTRIHAIHFVCHLMRELTDLALPFLHVLLQHICVQMVEKSEYRSRGAQAVGMLTTEMECTEYARFVKWLSSFSRSSKMVHRLFSVDVVMVLLEESERQPDECQDPELVSFLPHKFLIQSLLFTRRMDLSPTVQGHALACLSSCLELASPNVTQAVHNLFSATGTQTVLETESTRGSLPGQKTYCTLPFKTVELSTTNNAPCDARVNLALLLQRVEDSKVNVRKSALQALMSLLKYKVIPMDWETLVTLSDRCRDPAVSVKKKALQCLGELLSVKPECLVVQKAWLEGVLPAVLDSESSVQDKALEALDEVLFSQVKPYSASRHLSVSQRLTWDLLGLLCDECHHLSRYFSRVFTIWSKEKKFTPTFATNLISHTEADHAAAAWLLLSKVAASAPTLPYSRILDAWDNMLTSKDVSVTTCCHILAVMGDIAKHLNEDTRNRVVADLMSRLKTFTLSLNVISAAVETLYQFVCSEDIKQTQASMNQYCGELVSISEAYLAGVLLTASGVQNLNEQLMVNHLHTLGVASLHCPARVSKRTMLLVESVLTTHSDKLAECEELPASLPLSQFKTNTLPTKVRAHGVITLGKLCLQHKELAQKHMPVFARELEVGTEVAVRSNVVVIMCDLCVRYTNIVDHYIPNISACLRDPEPIIRKQTLIMLTNLLQEEFVKWKGSLFFRFMVALVDPVPEIASLCEYCLLHLLLKKNPEMFSQHFIECVFHFNSYHQHKTYNKFPQSDREKERFSLKGAQHREKRFRIYRFLLENFTDTQRFDITNRINQNVLACFADEELHLDADGSEILSETFKILSLKEMKLQVMSNAAGGGEELEEENVAMAKAVLQVARTKVVSQVQKRAFIENTVPIIISLKSLLEQKRSPVLRDLMVYLQVTMQDYRNEVKEFFSGDEQLAAEVEFALKTAERERELEEQMDNCSLTGEARPPAAEVPAQGSPGRRRSRVLSFTTPQQLSNPPSAAARLAHSDSRVRTSRKLDRVRPKSLNRSELLAGPVDYRAISTPNDAAYNITFEGDLSAINSGGSFVSETSLLHLQLNEQQAPGQRQWNVQSPLRKKKTTA